LRVTTAFNRILQVPGAWVDTVEFTDAGIVVGLRRRRGGVSVSV
jgi:transposase